jgi:hypothetical protein
MSHSLSRIHPLRFCSVPYYVQIQDWLNGDNNNETPYSFVEYQQACTRMNATSKCGAYCPTGFALYVCFMLVLSSSELTSGRNSCHTADFYLNCFFLRKFVDLALLATYYSALCVYVVFVASSIKQVSRMAMRRQEF